MMTEGKITIYFWTGYGEWKEDEFSFVLSNSKNGVDIY